MPTPDAGVEPPRRPEPMRWWHIPDVARLERVLFAGDSPWTEAMFWAELAAGHRYRVLLGDDGDGASAPPVIGYAGLACGPDLCEVQTIGVSPRAQHRGHGRTLLRDMLQAAGTSPVLLEVRTDNCPAIALYEAHGFAIIDTRRHYYQPSGADAHVMLRPGAARTGAEAPPATAPVCG